MGEFVDSFLIFVGIPLTNANYPTGTRKLNPDYITGFVDLFPEKPNNIAGFVDGTQKSLVVWGTNLSSSVSRGRITKQESNMIKLPPYQLSVVIGLLLSDGWLTFSNSRNKNVRLGFSQSEKNSVYVWYVFSILSHYCSNYPIYRTRKYLGKFNYGRQFFTRSLPCFSELYSLFYPKEVKLLPNNLYNLLTPVALAHLIMGDGAVRPHGLIICTDSYELVDIIRLMNILMIRYRLECTLRYHTPTQPRIYIKQRSMPVLRDIVRPYMVKTMLYKIG